jgi:predicted sulfurtransferase
LFVFFLLFSPLVILDEESSKIDSSLSWKNSGKELSPLEWHQVFVNKDKQPGLSSVKEKNNDITLLDCRNSYETDVGKFKDAIPLNTTFFSESWKALEDLLQNVPKDKPIYTYCTGGIRCVKVNAYLEQKLGYTNTYRLKGGIIAYNRELEKVKEQCGVKQSCSSSSAVSNSQESTGLDDYESRFQGVNYVFDERIGERITEDILTFCELCGNSCDSFINCGYCNVRLNSFYFISSRYFIIGSIYSMFVV